MDVEFDEEDPLPVHTNSHKQSGTRLTDWLIQKQFAKDEKQATWFMVGLVTVCVIASILLVAISSKGTSQLTQKQIQDITKRQQQAY